MIKNALIILLISVCSIYGFSFSSKPIDNTTEVVMPDKETTKQDSSTVKVYKQDGSLQCHSDTGFTLDEMAKQLNEIKILSKERKHDGKMRATVCGNHTGYINIYEVAASDLEQALKYGFKKIK